MKTLKIGLDKKTFIPLALSLIGALLSIGVLVYEVSILQKQVDERDIQIEVIRNRNDEQINKVDTLIREIEKEIQFTHGDRVISAEELINISNKRAEQLEVIMDSLTYYKMYYKMTQRQYKHNFSVDDKNNYTLDNIGLSRDSMLSEMQKLNAKITSLKKEVSKQGLQLKMYKAGSDKYDIRYIDYTIKEESDEISISYTIDAPRLDSALMLLPHYRKELKYIEKDSIWSIGIKRWF